MIKIDDGSIKITKNNDEQFEVVTKYAEGNVYLPNVGDKFIFGVKAAPGGDYVFPPKEFIVTNQNAPVVFVIDAEDTAELSANIAYKYDILLIMAETGRKTTITEMAKFLVEELIVSG